MEKIITVTYTHGKENFEILVNADLAYDYIKGKQIPPLTILEEESVFKSVKTGELQSSNNLKEAFGTTDLAKIVDIMLKKGHVPLTAEVRDKMLEDKKRQIIEIISKNSIDPKTNAPNPPLRIENAMKQAKVNIDVFKDANEQVEDIVKKINMIIPIKFATVSIETIVPPGMSNRCYGIFKHYGMKSENVMPDGSLKVVVELPAGMRDEFIDKISSATQGAAIIKILQDKQ
ncbi:MAG: ribosome assembly factor SBDS [Candidatus Micrarchaeia archaeon]